MNNRLIEKFESQKVIYEAFEKKCVGIVTELLMAYKLKYHVIESRVKETKSFRDKIERKIAENEEINGIQDITDILGLRIITYYEDFVDEIVNMLKQEFKVDVKNSVDKRNKDDRFGYSSVHLILELNEERTGLFENHRFNGLKFEIQIRSLLQHAWAVVSHELKYKNENSFPEEMSRKLARQSGLLEEVDDNFILIRKMREEYSGNVDENLESNFVEGNLNAILLEKYIESSKEVKEIAKSMLKVLNDNADKLFPPHDLSVAVQRLQLIEVYDLRTLKNKLLSYQKNMPIFFEKWMSLHEKKDFLVNIPGIPIDSVIYYLVLMVLIEKKDSDLYYKYAYKFIGNTEESCKEFVEKAKKMEMVWQN